MEAKLICLIVVIVLIVLVILLGLNQTSKKYQLQKLDGVVQPLNMDWCQAESLPSLSCYGQGSNIVYQRPLFPHLQPVNEILLSKIPEKESPGYFWGARPLSSHEAIAVYGEIPAECLYWSLNGYLFDKEGKAFMTSLGDPISSASLEEHSSRTGVAAILTANPEMFYAAKSFITQRWKSEHHPYGIKVYPIFIPREMFSAKARYVLAAQSIHPYATDKAPKWQTTIFQSPDISEGPLQRVKLAPRPSQHPEYHSEKELLEWMATAENQALKSAGKPVQSIPVFPPKFDSGLEAFRKGEKAYFDSRDITEFKTKAITLTKGQKIYVVANNHAITHKGVLSLIKFETATKDLTFDVRLTGNILVPRPQGLEKGSKVVGFFEVDPFAKFSGKQVGDKIKLRIVEQIFDNIGPRASSLLPMAVFVA